MLLRRSMLVLAGGVLLSAWAGAGAIARRQRAAAPRHKPIVALDPGHGGIDPGAIGPHGILEKNITLATALDLARELAQSGRYRPVLTRTSDVFVPLRRRVEEGRAAHAEVFLSIHANVLPNPALYGLSVYTLSDRATDRQTAALADSENRDDFLRSLNLSHQPHEIAAILRDLARRQTENRSLRLARAIVEELRREVPLLEVPRRSATFVVLTAPDIPSALVELGCLSNPDEERLLPTRAYQLRLARGLVAAIEAYFNSAASV
jgi:N-acetylmuramoyl-L-alanine amidase